jgi:hypothetical protein
MKGVGTELGGDEALDMGFGGGFDQEKLCGDSGGGEGGDDGFLASEGVGEGVQGVVVDWDGGDGGGEAMSAALASEDCDLEASVEELVEDGWAEIASGLRESLILIFWEGHSRGNETVS